MRRQVCSSDCQAEVSNPRAAHFIADPYPSEVRSLRIFEFRNREVEGTIQELQLTNTESFDPIGLTAEIVAAYVQNNPVPTSGLPDLIASVHAALLKLEQPEIAAKPAPAAAVNPKKSVFPDYIVSLEDGRKFRSMKRHLGLLGMTPDEYRAKWGLAKDYPMVAPTYAAQRSALAKSIGLGRKAAPPPKPVRAKRKANA
ncbi:transcriptional regulator [Mesorhizobium sp. B2-3-15]|nr:transcriptional regulator [Mesorhizobium sp. B2-3-15]